VAQTNKTAPGGSFLLVLIDLPEPGHPVREPFVTEAIGALAFQILFKGKLRSR
jgi:hypothetical protein